MFICGYLELVGWIYKLVFIGYPSAGLSGVTPDYFMASQTLTAIINNLLNGQRR